MHCNFFPVLVPVPNNSKQRVHEVSCSLHSSSRNKEEMQWPKIGRMSVPIVGEKRKGI